MKKVVIMTSAVLALGLAACHNNGAANNTANETAVGNNADMDVNAATANASVEANADAALNAAASETNAASNDVANAQNAVENK
ncbi:MAG TPA: circumsporozoite protein [Sphingomicrobium sp.]|nr:circumsporozoite protein [Sphingomicrobium sp.]